jgi:hypothetical protein
MPQDMSAATVEYPRSHYEPCSVGVTLDVRGVGERCEVGIKGC